MGRQNVWRPELRSAAWLPAIALLAGCAVVETRHALNDGPAAYEPVLGHWYYAEGQERCQIDIQTDAEGGVLTARCEDKPDQTDVLHFRLATVNQQRYAFVTNDKGGRYQLARVDVTDGRLSYALADPKRVAADVRRNRGTGWINKRSQSVLIVLTPSRLKRFIADHGENWFLPSDLLTLTREPAASREAPSSVPALQN